MNFIGFGERSSLGGRLYTSSRTIIACSAPRMYEYELLSSAFSHAPTNTWVVFVPALCSCRPRTPVGSGCGARASSCSRDAETGSRQGRHLGCGSLTLLRVRSPAMHRKDKRPVERRTRCIKRNREQSASGRPGGILPTNLTGSCFDKRTLRNLWIAVL